MRDFLLDIVSHTQALGCIDLIKIEGDKDSTTIEAISDDKSVVIKAKFKQPNAAFAGTFGMPNLVKLNTILNIPEYKENATIKLITQDDGTGNQVPSGLHFENQSGDFKNDYRFMPVNVINEKLKTSKFRGVKWDVEFTPAQNALQRFKFQAGANSEEVQFIAKTDGTDLKFYFGDHSTHAGNFVFHSGVTGKLTKEWNWPILRVLGILGLYGDKVMRFSDEGAAEITVDTGLIEYQYIIPAQSK
jgi:hypothetical protein